MKAFYGKRRGSIGLMLVLALLLQIVGPVVADYAYAAAGNESFKFIKEEIKGGTAFIDWELTLDPEDNNYEYEYEDSDFVLDEDLKWQDLKADDDEKTVVGQYMVSTDGKVSVKIEKELYKVFENEDSEVIEVTTPGSIEIEEIKTYYSGQIVIPEVRNKVKPLNDDDYDPVKLVDVKLVFKDEGGKPLEEPIPLDAKVEMEFKFEIAEIMDVDDENDLGIVDTNKVYSIDFPKQVSMSTVVDEIIDINHEDKEIDPPKIVKVGEATIKQKDDGSYRVDIVFLDDVNNYDKDRTAWFKANGSLELSELGDGGEHKIVFEGIDDKTVIFEKKTESVTLGKSVVKYNPEEKTIEWKITVKPETNPQGGIIKNVVVTDTIGLGHLYERHKIAKEDKGNITFNETNKTFTFDEVEDGKEYSVGIITKLDILGFGPGNEDKPKTFQNTVSGTFGEDEKQQTNSVTADYTITVDFINKSGHFHGRFDKEKSDIITWTININTNNLDMPAGTKFIDTISESDGLRLIPSTIKIDDIDIDKRTDVKDNTSGSAIEIVFTKGLKSAAKITFDTEITDIDDAYDPNKDGVYKNNASLEWSKDNEKSSVSSGEIGVPVGRTVIQKSKAGINRENHLVKWRITINQSKLDITNPKVMDILPKELEYISHTASPDIWGNDAPEKGINEKGEQTLTFSYTGKINTVYTIDIVTKIKEGYQKNIWY